MANNNTRAKHGAPHNPRSPWRQGPHCDTPNAGKSYRRYRDNAEQSAKRGRA